METQAQAGRGPDCGARFSAENGAAQGGFAGRERRVRVGGESVTVRESAAAKAWGVVRKHLRDSAGARLFDQWLKPIFLIETDEADVIRLGLPSAFATNWV